MASTCSRCSYDPAVRSRRNFTGGEFVLTEQCPRRQSRVEVVPLRPGEGVIFPASPPVAGNAPRHHAPRRAACVGPR
jgi:hypothetical protein